MNSPRPTVIDLFAGAGGFSLGFEQAGFDVVAAVEIDPIHAAVHKFNFPECTILPKSVSDISGKDLINASNGRTVDVLVGGAPCQGFSLIGQRALDDPRNSLVRDYIRLVIEIRPYYFVFENVKGLTVGKHRLFLEEIIEELTSAGYSVCKPWKVLNAKYFRVPQSRERLFLMGSLNAASIPGYPEQDIIPVSCYEALGDLPNAEIFDELLESDKIRYQPNPAHSAYAQEMRCETRESWKYGYQRRWDDSMLTSSLRTNHTLISRNRFAQTEQGRVEPISRFFKLSRDGISNTLRAGTDSARGAFTSPRPIHYEHPRCVTVREMARLHGFPDWFRFHETKWHGARQIGNAVPPPLAYAIGMQIQSRIEGKLTKPRKIIDLGDESLLCMDMSQASNYWGVENPIGKRNRKSGARKRKQFEIEAARTNGTNKNG